MYITVINMTHGLLSDKEIITAIRAINRQINEDFKPYWNMGATLRLEGCSTNRPDINKPTDMFDNIGLDKFVFKGAKNDGVVPFEGAGTFDNAVAKSIKITVGPEYDVEGQRDVYHTKFFSQPEVRQLLINTLKGY